MPPVASMRLPNRLSIKTVITHVRVTVKRNQKKLYAAIDRLFTVLPDWGCTVTDDYHKTVDSGHGRMETRECWTVSDPTYLNYVQGRSSDWARLSTIIKVRATRSIDGETTVETRYFIASVTDDAETMLDSVRLHWHVENAGHWVLDIAFREDESRIRQGNVQQNFAVPEGYQTDGAQLTQSRGV